MIRRWYGYWSVVCVKLRKCGIGSGAWRYVRSMKSSMGTYALQKIIVKTGQAIYWKIKKKKNTAVRSRIYIEGRRGKNVDEGWKGWRSLLAIKMQGTNRSSWGRRERSLLCDPRSELRLRTVGRKEKWKEKILKGMNKQNKQIKIVGRPDGLLIVLPSNDSKSLFPGFESHVGRTFEFICEPQWKTKSTAESAY